MRKAPEVFYVAFDPDCDWPSPYKVFVSEDNYRKRNRQYPCPGSRLFKLRLSETGLEVVGEVRPAV